MIKVSKDDLMFRATNCLSVNVDEYRKVICHAVRDDARKGELCKICPYKLWSNSEGWPRLEPSGRVSDATIRLLRCEGTARNGLFI